MKTKINIVELKYTILVEECKISVRFEKTERLTAQITNHLINSRKHHHYV